MHQDITAQGEVDGGNDQRPSSNLGSRLVMQHSVGPEFQLGHRPFSHVTFPLSYDVLQHTRLHNSSSQTGTAS